MSDECDDIDDNDGPPRVFAQDKLRDLAADVLACLPASSEAPFSISEIQNEVNVNSGGPSGTEYVPTGPIEVVLRRLVDSGAVAVVLLGDQLTPHWRKPVANADLQRAICCEMAGINADSAGRTAFQLAESMNNSSGGSVDAATLTPLLVDLVAKGVLSVSQCDVVLSHPEVDGEDGDAEPSEPVTAKVDHYTFADGVLFRVLTGGLASVLGGPKVALPDNASATDFRDRIARLEADGTKFEKDRDAALKRAAAAEARVAYAVAELERRGIHGVLNDGAETKPKASDPRGKPFQYEKRVKVEAGVVPLLLSRLIELDAEIDAETYREESAKTVFSAVRADVKKKKGTLVEQKRELVAAEKSGEWLLQTEAYRVFNVDTQQTEIRAWHNDTLLAIDDPALLPKGSQLEIPTAVPPKKAKKEPEPQDEDDEGDAGEDEGDEPDFDKPRQPKPRGPKPKSPRKPKVDHVADAEAAEQAKADDAAEVTPVVSGALTMGALKGAIGDMLHGAPDGVAWKDAAGQVTQGFLNAYAAHIGKPEAATQASIRFLLGGAAVGLVSAKLARTKTNEDGSETLLAVDSESKPKRARRKKDGEEQPEA